MPLAAEHSQLAQLDGEKRNARLAELISARGHECSSVTLSQLNLPNDPYRWDVRCSNSIEYVVHFTDQPQIPSDVPAVIVRPCSTIEAMGMLLDFARKCFQ
jgi:hypothetical protein